MFKAAMIVIAVAGTAHAQVSPTFAPSTGRLVPGSRANGRLELADVTGDAKLDAVLTDLIDTSIRVMPQTGAGLFADPVFNTLAAPVTDWDPPFTLADINGDASADIAVGLDRSNAPAPNAPNTAVLLGNPDGTFGSRQDYNNQPGIEFPNEQHDRGILLVDVNRDGFADLVTPSNNDFFNNPGCKLSVRLGDGGGGFGEPILSGAGHCAATQFILAGDINGDSLPDIITAMNSGSNSRARTAIQVNFGDGAGNFTAINTITLDMQLPTGSGNARIFVRDADGDGKSDIFAFGRGGSQSGAGGVYVMRSNGDGTFTAIFRLGYFGANTPTIGVEDLNGDSRPDIIMPGPGGSAGVVRVNDGAGGFDTISPFPALEPGYEARDIAAGVLEGSPLPSVVIMAVYDFNADIRLYTVLNTTLPAAACYANCDQSTGASVLTANDFACFLGSFVAGASYANCDGSTSTPVLTANDFACFVSQFAGGC